MTEITKEDMQAMSDSDLLKHLKKFPFKSQYLNHDAYEHAEYRIALIQGAKYMQTGKISSFKSPPF